jgi:hypothetical protein
MLYTRSFFFFLIFVLYVLFAVFQELSDKAVYYNVDRSFVMVIGMDWSIDLVLCDFVFLRTTIRRCAGTSV